MNKFDLGKKAIQIKSWSWMPGMLAIFVPDIDENKSAPIKERITESSVNKFNECNKYGNWIPDLNDPATTGCLLELVRIASESPCAFPENMFDSKGPYWRMRTFKKSIEIGSYRSEAELFVDVLEYFSDQ